MRQKIILFILLFYFLTFLSAFVMAEEDNKVVFKEPPTKESPQQWGLTLMGGTYRPSSYTGSGDAFGTIYSGQAKYI